MAKKPKSYLHFSKYAPIPGRKTDIWEVVTSEGGTLLGLIMWKTSWRRFAFFPEAQTLFEQDCLRELADFVENATRQYKENRP